jgi:hypothetical protein
MQMDLDFRVFRNLQKIEFTVCKILIISGLGKI